MKDFVVVGYKYKVLQLEDIRLKYENRMCSRNMFEGRLSDIRLNVDEWERMRLAITS